MPNENRFLRKFINKCRQAVYHFSKSELAQSGIYIFSQITWFSLVIRIGRSVTDISFIRKIFYPSVPAFGVLKKPVNKNNSFGVGHGGGSILRICDLIQR